MTKKTETDGWFGDVDPMADIGEFDDPDPLWMTSLRAGRKAKPAAAAPSPATVAKPDRDELHRLNDAEVVDAVRVLADTLFLIAKRSE
jgi:hypothetical protein